MGGAWLFLLVSLGLYLIAFWLAPGKALNAFGISLKLLYKLLPVLAFVGGLIFLSNLLVQPDWVKNHVGRESGIRGLTIAVLGGIVSVGPIYLWYEMLADLQRKGMRSGLVAAFLYARSVKPQLLPLMVHYFGAAYTTVMVFYLILFSILNGWLTERLTTCPRKPSLSRFRRRYPDGS